MIAPDSGQAAVGRGSMSSGASCLSSEYLLSAWLYGSLSACAHSLIRSNATMLCSSCTKRRTTNSKLCEMVVAKASAKPA